MQKDYSEYVPSEQEQYQLRRRGNEFIDFEYFNNRARFNPEHRTLDIQVDGKKESLWMDELVEEYESAREERGGEEFLGLDEDGTEEDWQDNEEDVSRLDKRYRVSYFPFEDLIKSDQLTETFGIAPRNVPMNNVLSGTDVNLKYGEGLLDFIYADFDSPAQLVLDHIRWSGAAFGREADAAPSTEKVYNQTQEIVDNYFAYQDTLRLTKDILKQSLYTMICPPVFADETDRKALEHYYSYLRDLQKEYLELLEFCFDESFYPELLGSRHPAERFYLYRDLHGYPVSMERAETVQFTSHYRTGQIMPYGMTTEEGLIVTSNYLPQRAA